MHFHGSRSERKIALTFDDGPCEETSQVLEILKEHGIRATFFIVGKMINGKENILDQAKRDGHEFGNHTFSHPNLLFKSKAFIENEITKCDRELEKVGIKTNLIRFPYIKGAWNAFSVCRKLKKKVIYVDITSFSLKSYDWWEPVQKQKGKLHRGIEIRDVIEKTIKDTRNGSILVFHDYLQGIGSHPELIPILKAVLPGLKARGFEFVTISELLGCGTNN